MRSWHILANRSRPIFFFRSFLRRATFRSLRSNPAPFTASMVGHLCSTFKRNRKDDFDARSGRSAVMARYGRSSGPCGVNLLSVCRVLDRPAEHPQRRTQSTSSHCGPARLIGNLRDITAGRCSELEPEIDTMVLLARKGERAGLKSGVSFRQRPASRTTDQSRDPVSSS